MPDTVRIMLAASKMDKSRPVRELSMQVLGMLKNHNSSDFLAFNMPQQIAHDEIKHEALVAKPIVATIYEDTEEDLTRGENDFPRSVQKQ